MSEPRDAALRYNPWGDDDSDYRVLRNVMAVTRKPSRCAMCFEDIPAGARVRAQSEIFEGKAMTFRFCPLCCEAMRARVSGRDCDGRQLEERTMLGQTNAPRSRQKDNANA